MAIIKLTKADEKKSLEVQKDDLIVIQLDENPTTGYRWAIDNVDEQVLTKTQSSFASVAGTGIGGGGGRTLSFKAIRTGVTPLVLKLWRDWEGDESIVDRYGVTIRISSREK